jgi:hypothetical protein
VVQIVLKGGEKVSQEWVRSNRFVEVLLYESVELKSESGDSESVFSAEASAKKKGGLLMEKNRNVLEVGSRHKEEPKFMNRMFGKKKDREKSRAERLLYGHLY